MNKKLLHVAVVAALGVSANTAMALSWDPTSPNYTMFLSGSSAASATVRDYTLDTMCDHSTNDGTTISVFRRWTGTKYGNDWAVACTLNSTTAAAAGVSNTSANVLFRKRDAGGSEYGVTPVIDPSYSTSLLAVVKVDTGSNCTLHGNNSTANGTVYSEYYCSTANDTLIPDGGFSDVEPDKFFGSNSSLVAFNPTSPANEAYADVTVGALNFGIPVSLKLRNALQAVQFPTSSTCNPLNAGYGTSTEDSEACMPGLTATQVREFWLSGFLGDWSSFMVNDTDNAGAMIPITTELAKSKYSTIWPSIGLGTSGLIGSAGAIHDSHVQVCTRTPGSGTRASFGIIFLNSPCDPSAATMNTSSHNGITHLETFFGSGSPDVNSCLNDYDVGANTATSPVADNPSSFIRWSIGIQSTENNFDLSLSYRFIKIDGAAPTIQNTWAGKWNYWAEESYQYRTDPTKIYNAGGVLNNQNDVIKLMTYIGANAVTPAALHSINNTYLHPWGDGGWLAIPGTAAPYLPSYPFDYTKPVNTQTRTVGGVPNTCELPVTKKAIFVGGNLSATSANNIQ